MPFKDPAVRRKYQNDYKRKRYAEDPGYKQKQKDNSKSRKRKLKQMLRDIKSDRGCKLCEESHVACLVFHHRDPGKKEFSLERMAADQLAMSRIIEEIAKCDVLCANCHRKLHWKEKEIEMDDQPDRRAGTGSKPVGPQGAGV